MYAMPVITFTLAALASMAMTRLTERFDWDEGDPRAESVRC